MSLEIKWESLIQHAELCARAAHFEQFDKGGVPRIEHVLHVGRQFEDPIHRIVGILHDTLEDSELFHVDGIQDVFGCDVARAVLAISRVEGESYFDYIDRVKKEPVATAVKIEDLKHNMDRRRWPAMPDSYYEREVKALRILQGSYE